MGDVDSIENYIIENRKLDLWKNIIPIINEYKRKNSNECRLYIYSYIYIYLYTYMYFIYTLVKELIRQGIPDIYRGYIWINIANVNNLKIEGLYQKLKSQRIDYDNNSIKEIIKDLHRTNPSNIFFKEKEGQGQKSLFNVLRTFSSYYKETGYVQGMGFYIACFLLYMDEESTFWLFYSLMETYNLKTIFKPDFPGLEEKYYVLLYLMKRHYEKLYLHLKEIEIYPSLYSMNWFLTLFFCNNRIPDTVIRIFDIYLYDKEKAIFRFGLAMLKANEEKILSTKEYDKLLYIFKGIEETPFDLLLGIAVGLKISSGYLESIKEKYEESKSKPDEILGFIRSTEI